MIDMSTDINIFESEPGEFEVWRLSKNACGEVCDYEFLAMCDNMKKAIKLKKHYEIEEIF